ncbi:MAG TPA: hypothetical protein VKF61_03065 [Candidatus Polarisedimenticolia bacterium]|nr:hypothetical protein [Candidatus Polarisedimenticolia bacterium]
MARRSGSTFKKRQKEMARQQKAQDKFARRLQKKKEREETPTPGAPGEDPDIAGIRPGPQPPIDDLLDDKR